MEESLGRRKKTWVKPARRFTTLIFCFFLLNTNPAWGSARQFIPRYVDFSGNMQISAIYEKDRTETKNNNTSRSDSTFLETLNFSGFGYIYNPLFIIMQTSLGLGLKQEKIDTAGKTSSFSGESTTFSHRFKILPTHPYNFELHFKRYTPLTRGGAGESGSNVIYRYGAVARYKKRPWSTTLDYTSYDVDSATTDNQTQFINYSLYYSKKGLNIGGNYNHNEASRSNGTSDSSKDSYALIFNKAFNKAHISSRWNSSKQEEDETTGGVVASSTLERQELHGAVTMELPYNFKSNLSYDLRNRDDLRNQAGSEKLVFSDTEQYNFRLQHRLFKSLSTSFNAGFSTIDSTGGETKQERYRLGTNYSKKMRWGRMTTGLWYGIADLDSKGAPITGQLHKLPENDTSIELAGRNIAEDSIEIRVIDHNNNNRQLLLTKSTHYTVTKLVNSFRININDLPFADLVDPDGQIWDYDYEASFALLSADFVIRTTDWGGGLQMPMFDNLITPHYSYSESKQKELEGDFPGDPANSKNHTLGLGFNKKNFQGDLTFSWLRSNTASEDRLNAYLNYRKDFTPFIFGRMTLTYDDGDIRQKDSNTNQITELNETLYTAQAQVQTILPHKKLNGSITTNYSLYKGTGKNTSLSFFSTLTWRVGRTDLQLSASYTDSESEGGGTTTKRQFTSVRVELKRELF